ncbi:MAG: DNA alkylation repair protein [candidate division Zixibacteria bacterium]|nr:DNA alkylation repair protein [candidate division Zixibacteria bacterium]
MIDSSCDKKRILDELARELAKYKSRKYRIDAQRFHKTKLTQPLVLKAAVVRKIAAMYYRQMKSWPAKEVFDMCELLLESNLEARKSIAFDWAWRRRGDYRKSDFRRFESWGRKHFNGWGSVDHLCTGALGYLVYLYPELTAKTKKWAHSRNIWMRRASAVCLIYSCRRGEQLRDVFQVTDTLLTDKEDLVQKGYGWMLKEAADSNRDKVFAYVMKRKDVMPRTALRYAIEKMPPAMKKRSMAKD